MKKIILLLLIQLISNAAFAGSITCPKYGSNKNDTLFNAGLVADNEDLVPDREVQKDKILSQFFKLKQYQTDKIFLGCEYQSGKEKVIQIPISVSICKRTYINFGSPEIICQ